MPQIIAVADSPGKEKIELQRSAGLDSLAIIDPALK
jgi:hypothetical protein